MQVTNNTANIVTDKQIENPQEFIIDVPGADEHLACYGHHHFHLVLFFDLSLMVGETAEEAVLGSAGAPCALDDCPSQVTVSMRDAP